MGDKMLLDLLIAEIGSTTTLVNGFRKLNTGEPEFVGQGLAPTTVLDGDVTLGLQAAIDDLKQKLDLSSLEWQDFMATSSAAGGLKMTVHGLVKDMTVKAAREAALGAGAVIKKVTAGRLRNFQLRALQEEKPNIILLAGGVDYGEEDIIIDNARKISELPLETPVIYAGNCVLQEEVAAIFKDRGREILVAENVYPEIDNLNIYPTRKLIHEAFARHIVRAPGMEKIREMLTVEMLPTPGAVMEAARLLKEEIGNLVVIDVGGATTDVHSVTEDSPAIREILLNPEPESKRSVEGDLGVYLNAARVRQLLLEEEGAVESETETKPLPRSRQEAHYTALLAEKAALTAVRRHAGRLRDYFGPTGRETAAEGKDLTAVKWVIGTGGALTRLGGGREVLEKVRGRDRALLLPPEDAGVLLDQQYIMASLGMMSKIYPRDALMLLKSSLGLSRSEAEKISL